MDPPPDRQSPSAVSSARVARRARQALLAEIEADAGDRADNQSLAGFGYEEEFEDDLFGDLPRDGYRSVVEVLAARLDVKFNAEAVLVQVEADGIRVTCADGSVETGSQVVVTVPLGVLKRARKWMRSATGDDIAASRASVIETGRAQVN